MLDGSLGLCDRVKIFHRSIVELLTEMVAARARCHPASSTIVDLTYTIVE